MTTHLIRFTVVSMFLCLNSFGQETSQNEPKTQNRIFRLHGVMDFTIKKGSSTFNLSTPQPSLTLLNKKGNQHEIRLSSLYVNVSNSISTPRKAFGAGIAYQYNQVFMKQKESLFKPFLGFYGVLDYDWSRREFQEANLLFNSFGIDVGISPGIQLTSKRFFMALSFPISVYRSELSSRRTAGGSTGTTIRYNQLSIPKLGVNLSLGFRF